jgi:hypothetical protein
MPQCPKCECLFTGRKCACGYQPPTMLGIAAHPGGLQWKLCEWEVVNGRTCQVPTGTLGREGVNSPMRPHRLCAYHRARQSLSLYGTFTSEQQAFLNWVEQFPAGTRYQPLPGIWDLDRIVLWQLVSGEVSWNDFQAWSKGLKESA